MFNKKKKQSGNAGDNAETQTFEKNIKTLWIYTTLFCLFALALIVISSFVQIRLDDRAEYYQDQYETVQTSSQSTIKNIQTENEALKKDIEKYKNEADFLKEQFKTEEKLLASASSIIENADYLFEAQSLVSSRDYKEARGVMAKIDETALTDTMLEIYNQLKDKLGI